MNFSPNNEASLSFLDALRSSSCILCVVGAGLSASSGLPTWRGTNGLWNNITPKELASYKRFQEDPVTVWRFYGERLLQSLQSQPNDAHHALAALAQSHQGWLTVNQNVDGLLELTEHPEVSLMSIHGTLATVRCTICEYSFRVREVQDLSLLSLLLDPERPNEQIALSDLPYCPECSSLLRPGVVWFGERLLAGAPDRVDDLIWDEQIDLVVVIGTSLEVFPTAEWVFTAHANGVPVALFDEAEDHRLVDELLDSDWFFHGAVAEILPRIYQAMLSEMQIISLCHNPTSTVLSAPECTNQVVRITSTLAVKFGPTVTFEEFKNQQVARQRLDANVVNVPQAYRFLQLDGIGYIVMDYVEGRRLI